MTAPDDTFQGSTAPSDPAPRTGRNLRPLGVEVGLFLLLLAGGALLGLLFGAMWHWLAPRVPMHSDSTAVYLDDPEGEQAIGADGTFALLGAGFGVVTGVVVYLATRARQGGVGVALGLAGGSLLGGYVAWGGGLSAKAYQAKVLAIAKSVPTGHTFHGPLELTTKAVLTVWPIAAVLVLILLTTLFTPAAPAASAAPPQPWDTPPGTPAQDGPAAP